MKGNATVQSPTYPHKQNGVGNSEDLFASEIPSLAIHQRKNKQRRWFLPQQRDQYIIIYLYYFICQSCGQICDQKPIIYANL